jgi:hypothetical protein
MATGGRTDVTFWSTIRFCGLSPSTGVSPMRSTTSIPEVTSPKMVNLPVRDGWSESTTKNWLPPLSGRLGWSTAATDPRTMGRAENSALSRPSPPVP